MKSTQYYLTSIKTIKLQYSANLQGQFQNFSPWGAAFANKITEVHSLSTFKQMLDVCIFFKNVTSPNHEEVSTNMDPYLFFKVFYSQQLSVRPPRVLVFAILESTNFSALENVFCEGSNEISSPRK